MTGLTMALTTVSLPGLTVREQQWFTVHILAALTSNGASELPQIVLVEHSLPVGRTVRIFQQPSVPTILRLMEEMTALLPI